MWKITAQREGVTTTTLFKTLREANAAADALVEELYDNVIVALYTGQLPLFDGECYEDR